MSSFGWIGFDLDRTLARYDRWKGELHIGEPVPTMIAKVQAYLAQGWKVKVFTARMADPAGREAVAAAIAAWCLQHIGQALEATCVKDYECVMLYDDIARQVVPNEGIVVGESA